MILRTSLLALVGAVGLLASGCFVSVNDDPVYLDTYEPCDVSSDCVPGDDCVDITVTNPDGFTVNDGMCTHGCVSDADCPTSPGSLLAGACYEVGGASALCYERCDFDSDCPFGFACYPTSGVPDAICLPN